MRHAPVRLSPKGKLKAYKRRVRKARQPKDGCHQAMQLIACDNVVIVRDGIRRYITTFIDPVSRFTFACASQSGSSRSTTNAFAMLIHLLPTPPRAVLTDNGSEFMGHFDATLKQRQIERYFTYPQSPKMNAHCERFNRTIQESFSDYHEDLLFTDLPEFNRKLAHWLLFYNTRRPHVALNMKSPIQWLIQNQPNGQRLWTYTLTCMTRGVPARMRALVRGCLFPLTINDVRGALHGWDGGGPAGQDDL